MCCPLVDTPLVGDVATPVAVTAIAALSLGLLAAQEQVQAATGSFISVNVTINRLMADGQHVCYLLWAVCKAHIVINRMPCLGCNRSGVA